MKHPSRPTLTLKYPATPPASEPPLAPIEPTASEAKPRTRHERVIVRLAELRDRWPATFRAHSDPGPWPALKVAIHIDIATAAPELAVPRGLLRDALRLYVSRSCYLAAVVEDAPRFGLDGEPCGEVTAAQAAHAGERRGARRGVRTKRKGE